MEYYVYILTTKRKSALYIGVTNNLRRRLYEHKNGIHPGFTKRYHFCLLVYFEKFSDIKYAIHREKVLKGWCRYKKLELINSINPAWNDLSGNWSASD